MTRLVLIRHGQTDWNIEGRWQGHADVPLNANGHEQAARMAAVLVHERIAAIYSSDLTRARQTAQALGEATGLIVHVDKRLREIHQGEWQGLEISEIRSRYRDAYEAGENDPAVFAPPGGETLVQLRDRLVAALQDIYRRHPGQCVAVVSHGFAVAMIRAHFAGMPMQKAWDMIPENEQWHVLTLDDVSMQALSAGPD
jgi:broad specificity phosphatase PhoE